MVDSPRPKRRVVLVVSLVSAGVLLLCCVGTMIVGALTQEDEADPEAAAVAYTVASVGDRRVVLVQSDASADSARAAIRHWVDHNDAGEYRVIEVVRAGDATLYVCRARYVRDERVSAVQTGGEVKGPYPALAIHCP